MASIDVSKVHDFSKKKTYEDIERDILRKYKVANLDKNEETVYKVCDTLLTDYEGKLANYESYIEKGINLRLLMELRNTAIQNLTDKELGVFHNETSPMEVVNKRAKIMHRIALDDVVEPWQLYLISVKDKRIQKAYENCDIKFTLNFEECYIDCDINCIMTKEDFIKDFALNMRKDTGAIHKTFMHKY